MHPEVTSSLTPKAPILPRALFYMKVEKTPRKSSIVKTSANKSLGKNLNRNNVKLSLFILRMQLVYGTLVYIGGASFLLEPIITKPRLSILCAPLFFIARSFGICSGIRMKRMLSCMISLLAASLLVMLSTEELVYQANNASIQIMHVIQISIRLCDILLWIYYYFILYCKVIFSGDRRNISMISRSEPDPDHIVFMASQTLQQPPTKYWQQYLQL